MFHRCMISSRRVAFILRALWCWRENLIMPEMAARTLRFSPPAAIKIKQAIGVLQEALMTFAALTTSSALIKNMGVYLAVEIIVVLSNLLSESGHARITSSVN